MTLVRPESDLRRIADLAGRLEIVRADLERDAKPTWPGAPDLCVHLAWRGIGTAGIEDANTRSLTATANLLRGLSASGCGRFVGIGSGLEYRESDTPHRESDAIGSRVPYGAAKAAAFREADATCRDRHIELAWIRLFHVYGPDDDPLRFIPWLIRTLAAGQVAPISAGAQRRDYLYVSDAADAIWTIASGPLTGPVNAASGVATSLGDVARSVAEILARTHLLRQGAAPYIADEPRVLLADTSRLFAMGWRPRFPLLDGIRDTVAWWVSELGHV